MLLLILERNDTNKLIYPEDTVGESFVKTLKNIQIYKYEKIDVGI